MPWLLSLYFCANSFYTILLLGACVHVGYRPTRGALSLQIYLDCSFEWLIEIDRSGSLLSFSRSTAQDDHLVHNTARVPTTIVCIRSRIVNSGRNGLGRTGARRKGVGLRRRRHTNVCQLHVTSAARATLRSVSEVEPNAQDLRTLGRSAHCSSAHVTPYERAVPAGCKTEDATAITTQYTRKQETHTDPRTGHP